MNRDEARKHAGLCAACRHAQMTRSDRGAVFYQCGKSFEDPRFPRYPRLPMLECSGYDANPDARTEPLS
jgi:hypothetical protein